MLLEQGEASQVALAAMNLPAGAEDTRTWVQALGREDPWRRKWHPTPVFLPGESHGEGSLVGYSPRGHKESDRTEQLSAHASALNSTSDA